MIRKKTTNVDDQVLNKLLLIGEQMSNICYNFSQNEKGAFNHSVGQNKEVMARLVREWDAARKHLKASVK